MKTLTSVRIDEKIHRLAIDNGINLSQALEEALTIKLSIPKTEDHIIEDIGATKERLEMLEKELNDFQGYKNEQEFKQKIEARKKDEHLLVEMRAKMLHGKISGEAYNKALRAFSAKHNVEFAQTVRIAEARGSKNVKRKD